MSSPKPSFWCRAQQALPSFSHCSGQMVRCNFALQSMAVCSFPELKGGNQVDVTRTEIRRFWQDPCPEWSYVNTALQGVHTQAFCHLRIFSPWVQGNPVWDRINISLLCILPLHSIHCPVALSAALFFWDLHSITLSSSYSQLSKMMTSHAAFHSQAAHVGSTTLPAVPGSPKFAAWFYCHWCWITPLQATAVHLWCSPGYIQWFSRAQI